jgi:DNA-binding transcriptional LysR family regulator
MDLRKLHHGVTLARFLNFTRAAHDLNITQSALSRSIQALESECRLQLFDRNRGMVALTQAGREFIQHAELLLRKEAALQNSMGHVLEGNGGHVTLGVSPLVARVFVAPTLAKWLSEPNFHAEVILTSGKHIFSMLVQETIDLGICMVDSSVSDPSFRAVTLAKVPMAVVVRKDHPLTRLKNFGAEDMAQYPLIRSSGPDDGMPFVVGLRSISPAVTVEEYDVLEQIVATSDAVWVTSPVAAKRAISNGEVTPLRMSWLPESKISLVAYTLAMRQLTPLAEAVLGQFKRLGAELSR